MEQDSVINVVHDTIFVTKEKYDTIYQVVHDTVFVAQENDIIGAYQRTIYSQATTYNAIITVFLGLVALFAGATWWYNRKASKSEIIDEVRKVFEKEKEDFLEGQKLEFNNELHVQKAESARLFAAFNLSIIKNAETEQDKFLGYSNLIYWWHQAYINNFIAGNQVGERLGIDQLILSLQKVIDDKVEIEFLSYYQANYDYQYLYDTLKYINDSLLVEKRKILTLLNHIAKENELEFTPKDDSLDSETVEESESAESPDNKGEESNKKAKDEQ